MFSPLNRGPHNQHRPPKTGADDLRSLAGWLAAGGTLYCLVFVIEGYHQAVFNHFRSVFDEFFAQAATWTTYLIASGASFYFLRIAIFAILSVLIMNAQRLPFAFG